MYKAIERGHNSIYNYIVGAHFEKQSSKDPNTL